MGDPVEDKIREAQRQVLIEMEACELAVCGLYVHYAVRLPAMADFWNGLAHEERGHALLLHSLQRILDRRHLFHDLGRFDVSTFQSYVAHIRKETEASEKGLTPEKAVSTALSCEKALVESSFFDVVTSDAPEFAQIAKHLAAASREHVRLVERMLVRLRTRSEG